MEKPSENIVQKCLSIYFNPLTLDLPFKQTVKLQIAFYRGSKYCKTKPLKYHKKNNQSFIDLEDEKLHYCTTISFNKAKDKYYDKKISVQLVYDVDGKRSELQTEIDLKDYMPVQSNYGKQKLSIKFSNTIVLNYSIEIHFEDSQNSISQNNSLYQSKRRHSFDHKASTIQSNPSQNIKTNEVTKKIPKNVTIGHKKGTNHFSFENYKKQFERKKAKRTATGFCIENSSEKSHEISHLQETINSLQHKNAKLQKRIQYFQQKFQHKQQQINQLKQQNKRILKQNKVKIELLEQQLRKKQIQITNVQQQDLKIRTSIRVLQQKLKDEISKNKKKNQYFEQVQQNMQRQIQKLKQKLKSKTMHEIDKQNQDENNLSLKISVEVLKKQNEHLKRSQKDLRVEKMGLIEEQQGMVEEIISLKEKLGRLFNMIQDQSSDFFRRVCDDVLR